MVIKTRERSQKSSYIIKLCPYLIGYVVFIALERSMGKWKCLWYSKVLEGESFMDLIAASAKEDMLSTNGKMYLY